MVEHLHFHTLFHSTTVSICDVACRPYCCDCGGEEWVDAPEVVFPRSGVFIMHLGRESVVADSNHVLFLNRRQPFRVSHPVPGGDDCTSLILAPEVLVEVLELHDPAARDRPHRVFCYGHGPRKPIATLLLHKLRRYVRNPIRDNLTVEELGFELLDSVVRQAYGVRGRKRAKARPSTASAHKDTVHATKTTLAVHLGSRLSLEKIARAVCCSRFHLARLFRQHTGISIHEYRSRLRLAKALERLADGQADLTQLALDLGYSSHSHFSAAFQRAFGTSPSGFRRTATVARLREMSTNLTA